MKLIPETALDHLVLHIKDNFKTQTAAAKAWGVSVPYLNSVVKGRRPIPHRPGSMDAFDKPSLSAGVRVERKRPMLISRKGTSDE